MKKFIILLSLIFLSVSLFSQTITGKVVGVSDGDTFTLLTDGSQQVKVRLHGIDCPEKSQAYGEKAKQFTSAAIFGRYVDVNVTDTDKYGRKVGIAYINDTLTLNESLLIAGLAWHYKQYDNTPLYAQLESEARSNQRGLWADPNPIEPWNFRKGTITPSFPTSTATQTSVQETTNKTEGMVLICLGKSAYAYHSGYCSGLSRCRSGVSEVAVSEAKSRGYRACKNCY